MKQYRITKYNPMYRDIEGIYSIDEWTSISDIGKLYGSREFSLPEYLKVESKYIEAIALFMKCNDLNSFVISEVEKYSDEMEQNSANMESIYHNIKEGDLLNIAEIPNICRLLLREYMWGKFAAPTMFVHFGQDYYMYIGVTKECENVIDRIIEMGLFVEEFESPYGDEIL